MHVTRPNQSSFASQASLPPSYAIEHTDADVSSAPPTIVITPPTGTQPPRLLPNPTVEIDKGADTKLLKPPTSPNIDIDTNPAQSPTSSNLPFALQVPMALSSAVSAVRTIGEHHADQSEPQQPDSPDPTSAPAGGVPEPDPRRSPTALVVREIIGGALLAVLAPTGAAFFAAGGAIFGVGLVLRGIGGALTCCFPSDID
ncbi:hypothetical protein BDN72DRAFT_842975, partial [Pluteus cervinus]